MIDPHIFRAYDIRGKALTQLTEESCELIGKAFGSIVREKYALDHPKIVIGRDMRASGPLFEEAMIRGAVSTGCQVLEIGETPSPLNYFTICRLKLDGGLQITASHNPSEDNGVKLQIRDAVAFAGEDIQTLRKRIEAGNFLTGTGSRESVDAVTPFLNWVKKQFGGSGKGLTVAIDCGNGMTGPVAMKAFRETGCSITGLYTDPDGNFPNHLADPSKQATLKDLQDLVKKQHADIGFAFDGDGDRVGLIDENGEIRSADEVLLFLAQDYLQRFPGKPVIFTVAMSSTLETEIRKWGGEPIMCPVGHSYVEHEMRKHGAPLGGEQSGHFFLEDIAFGYDDALTVALQILAILKREGKPLSEVLGSYPKVFIAHERRPHCEDGKKAAVIASVIEHFQKTYPTNTMDGARIDFGEGAWANIRQSNTAPKISICVEARSEAKLKAVEAEILEHMKKYPEVGSE
ncbi:MAG: phosphomannomutase/phosphoglucomutase [Candidatus Peregrinibacteria bacterium]